MGDLKTLDAKHLSSKEYGNFSKLGFRKYYNSFAVPTTKWEDEIFDFIKKSGAKKILDVGCGNGDLLILIRKNGFKGELVGVELSAGILAGGINESEENKLDINFVVGDAQNLPFEDECFDVVIAKHMIYHIPNPQKGIDEMYRCLKRGGSLLITLNSKNSSPHFHACEKLICEKFNLHTEHGQDLINVENITDFLGQFSNIETKLKNGLIKKPELFGKYVESFRGVLDPEPSDVTWGEIESFIADYIKKEKQKAEFIETRITGLMIAKK